MEKPFFRTSFFLRQTIFHSPETDFPFCAKRFHHLRQDGYMPQPDKKLKDGIISFSRQTRWNTNT
ncbi:hypothetical protein HMPREF9442_01058 [Paraprevotella xylaniphila YIT 11841]|uniref:Uncharacterized protein n=1 Tax=Paraprevotella xylaniphila YIT 11841 TaxID=762982 RepID=F3QSA2_9BACT|nr:hypothetical protein HMPREF9442_01058 [Paraprevotella xylaniphila YIT 11841]